MENGQLSPARVPPGEAPPLLLQSLREHCREVGRISVLKALGTVDATNATAFSVAVADHITHADRAGEHPLLDLSEAYLGCVAGVRALDRATGILAFAGRALPVVQPRPHIRETLRAAGLPGVRVHATMASALHALEPGRAPRPPEPPAGRPHPGGAR